MESVHSEKVKGKVLETIGAPIDEEELEKTETHIEVYECLSYDIFIANLFFQVSEDGQILGAEEVAFFELKPRMKASVVTVIMQENLQPTTQ